MVPVACICATRRSPGAELRWNSRTEQEPQEPSPRIRNLSSSRKLSPLAVTDVTTRCTNRDVPEAPAPTRMLSTFFDGMEVLTMPLWIVRRTALRNRRELASRTASRSRTSMQRYHADAATILAPDGVAQGGSRAEIPRVQARYPAVFRCNPSSANDGDRAPPSATTRLRSRHDTPGAPHRSANERLSSLTRSLSPNR